MATRDIAKLYQVETKRINELFDKFDPKDIVKYYIFFESNFYDAYSILLDILSKAEQEIIIIDNYAGKELLDLLKKINKFKETYLNNKFFCYNYYRGDNMKYISIGQAAYDITLIVDEYPEENSKIKTNTKITCGGGSAANSAYFLSSWNENSYFAGTIGNDIEANFIEKELKDVKVNLKYLNKENINTPISYILTNKTNSKRTIVTYKDKITKLKTNLKVDKDFDCIVLDGYEKDFADLVLYENKNAISILDAGRVNIDVIDLAYKVDYVITSKVFAEKYTNIDITNKSDLIKIYDILYNKFNTNIVITLEESGCFTKINDDYMEIPTIEVDVVDTTGAGDIFHASFAYFITHKYSFFDSLRLSNICASLSTKYIGTRGFDVSVNEVLDIYEELYK